MRQTKILIALLLFVPCLHAQNWSPFLDPSRAIDWTSNVGFTIPAYTTNCTTQPTLLTGSGNASANATAIQNALNSCDATHNVVNLPSGTYSVAGWTYPSHGKQVVRGAGPALTYLTMTTEASCFGQDHGVCMISGSPTYNGASNVLPGGNQQCLWTGGLTKGSTSLTLSSCGGAPPVNHMLILDQANDSADTNGIYICDINIANCGYEGPSGGGGNNDGRFISGSTHSQQQVTYITGVTSLGGGSYTVTVQTPVYFNNIRSGQAPGAWWSDIVQNDGLENVTVDGTALADGNIGMYDCYQCWVKNVRSIDAARNHVLVYQSAEDVIRDSYFFASQSHASVSYTIESDESSGFLVENNIFQQVTNPIMFNQASGAVVGYNFSIDDIFVSGFAAGSYSSHNAGNGMNLFESNNFIGIWADDAWGSPSTTTKYRNNLIGWGAAFTSSTIPLLERSFVRAYNYVGNVLGQPGYHTQYQSIATSTTGGTGAANENTSIYSLGWAQTGATCGAPNCDALVATTAMRWGNWDVVTNATRWNTTEAAPAAVPYANANFSTSYFSTLAQTLPSSLYYNSKPSWYPSAKVFPAIGPDVTTGNVGTCSGTYSGAQATTSGQCTGGTLSAAWASHVVSIPAQDCYLNVMGGHPDGSGSVLSFDANTCAAAAPPGTTWYIRTDGSNSTNCTGKTNAAYPGSGTGQACAFNHPYWMINTAGTGWAHMVAGDTVQFADTGTSKTYLMGEQNAGIGTDWNANGLSSICAPPNPGQANGASCIMPAPPNNTTWLGQNAGSCHDSGHSHLVNPTILSGIAGAFAVLDTRSTSGVTYSCIEVTQPDTCTTVGNGTGMCGNLSNFVHFGGLVMNYLTGPGPTSLTLTDFAAVGIGSQGILGSNLRGTTTLTDVYVIGNGGEGWNADGGGCGTSCEDTGTINEHYNIYAWNGCMAVNYDMTKTFQLNSYNYCMAQTTGAFASGDGQVMIAAGNVTLNVDHSQFQNNVQDGFDALHLNDDPSTTPSININTSIAAHNLGQTFKLGAGSNSTAINNVSVQDCRAMTVDANYPLNPSGWSNGNTNVADQCRAQGEAWVFAVKAGATVTARNNTTIGYGTTTYTVGCAVGVTTCITGGAIMAFQNNTTYALPDPGNSGQFASGFFFGNGDIFANAGSVMSFNNWYQMRTGCPNSTTPEETNQVCGNPGFASVVVSTDGTLITVNPNITSSSLLAAAGTHIAGITTDYNGNAVTNPPAIGAFTPTGVTPPTNLNIGGAAKVGGSSVY